MRFEHSMNGINAYLGSPTLSTRIGSASVRIAMSDSSDESDEFDSIPDTEDGRLSRSLQSWMCDHSWSTVEPLEKVPKEPVFSGKLGKDRKSKRKTRVRLKEPKNSNNTYFNHVQRPKTAPVRRVPSDDSITTSLSLLTCSSLEVNTPVEEIVKGKRRRRRKVGSRPSTATTESSQQVVSKWSEFDSRGADLKRMFRNQAASMQVVGYIAGADDDDESKAFRMFDKDEQEAVFKCGSTRGLKYVNKITFQRSSSVTDVDKEDIVKINKRKSSIKRVLSANAKKSWGPPLDIAQIKRDKMNRLMAAEQARQQQEKERLRRARRHLLARNNAQRKLNVTPSVKTIRSSTSSATPSVVSGTSNVPSMYSEPSSDFPSDSFSDKFSYVDGAEDKDEEEVKVTVWKNDREILEIDLNREHTQKVKERIASTRSALNLATGYGETNKQKTVVGTHEEFPKHVEDDFSHKPRIIQKMRISPHLSNIIHNDIQVRMGRPRYHEIRTSDLEQWDKGQELNRAHRNLKVFNWLHSLRDVYFITNVVPDIDDTPPADDSLDLELLHVESADEPDLKPLYRQYEVSIL